MISEHVCPAGLTCSANRSTSPNLAHDACPAGHYCLAGNIESQPQPCPHGTYLPFTGATSIDDCILCPKGIIQSSLRIFQFTVPGCSSHYIPKLIYLNLLFVLLILPFNLLVHFFSTLVFIFQFDGTGPKYFCVLFQEVNFVVHCEFADI